ncbi:MAG: hypothetical protein KDA79_21255 [Planctomycetaceae bacterium]|nr:hypothetical protein [Planctomycetaceae bacterium]
MSSNGQAELRLGFLTAIETADGGYAGGLLVTNRMGRPLEFQCTAPVRPNHTQELLYGPTLRSWVFGDLIGRTLVTRVSVKPDVVFVDQPEFLDLRQHVSVPVACVSETDDEPAATGQPATSAGGGTAVAQQQNLLQIGGAFLRFDPAYSEDREAIQQQAEVLPAAADLGEPFDRVREALRETVPV